MSSEKNIEVATPGVELCATLSTGESDVGALCWSPDGSRLAAAARDRTVRIWDMETATARSIDALWLSGGLSWAPDGATLVCATTGASARIATFSIASGRRQRTVLLDKVRRVTDVDWSPGGDYVACGTGDGLVALVDTRTWRPRLIDVTSATIDAIAWDGRNQLACSSFDGFVHMWSTPFTQALAGQLPTSLRVARYGPVLGLAWSRGGHWLAVAGADGVITIIDVARKIPLQELEAHSGGITALQFSVADDMLYSKSLDGTVRVWRTDPWECVSIIEEPQRDRKWPQRGCAAHPTESKLATLGADYGEIRIWRIQSAALTASPEAPTTHYSNAKVILVGDTGVGKSGLGKVLAGEPYEATDSTHGRKIWVLNAETVVEDGQSIDRETYLWDLAGQPGYRLVHQLHLNDTAVALVVFDARSEIDPFAGVRHWTLALRQAARLDSLGYSTVKILVAGRGDRGGTPVGTGRLNEFLQDQHFDEYFKTSARDGWGVSELLDYVNEHIPWHALPRVSSTELFTGIRSFLAAERGAGRLLTREDDLYRAFVAQSSLSQEDARDEFATCVGRADSRGLIKRLSFGGLVLLQPELLDAYASALVNAAKDEPDGMGSIKEDAALKGDFAMSNSERLSDRDAERLLLIATVEDLLRHEIALKEQGEDGPYLVFPTQFTRAQPDSNDLPTKATVITFEGPIQHVYATLVVRVAHSGIFSVAKMWHKAATFAHQGGEVGFMIDEARDGRGTLTLMFDGDTTLETRVQFESFVLRHLRRRAATETVTVRRVFNCLGCGWEIPEDLVARMRQAERPVLQCPVCSANTTLDRDGGEAQASRRSLLEMDRTADISSERAAARAALIGKERTEDYDVFLAHNSEDEEMVLELYESLRHRGIYPWLDKKAIPPGRWFQQVIQDAIPQVRAAAIVLGEHGIGQWQRLELRSFISQCIEREMPTIPVFLPKAVVLPAELVFLAELNAVRFEKDISEDSEALDRLVWGITGEAPPET
jgi:WD40 repeat protein